MPYYGLESQGLQEKFHYSPDQSVPDQPKATTKVSCIFSEHGLVEIRLVLEDCEGQDVRVLKSEVFQQSESLVEDK